MRIGDKEYSRLFDSNPPPIATADLEAWAKERPGLRSYTTSYTDRTPDGCRFLVVSIVESSEYGLRGDCREITWLLDGAGELYTMPSMVNIVVK